MRIWTVVALALCFSLAIIDAPCRAADETPAAGSLLDTLNGLETSVYGQPHAADSLAGRVVRLEVSTLGHVQEGSLKTRVDWLHHVVQEEEPKSAATAGTTALKLDPTIENQILTPFKPDTGIASRATVLSGSVNESDAAAAHASEKSKAFRHGLGVALSTTMKAAVVVAGAALAAYATSAAYSSSPGYMSVGFNGGYHRDLCACHYTHHHHR